MYRIKFITSIFLACVLAAWVLFTEQNFFISKSFHPLKWFGIFSGYTGYLFLSISLFLASRFKKLEDWLGGLDQIYHVHHQLGILGCFFSLLHPLILAGRWLPNHFEKFLLYIFPIHGRLAINFGSYSLLLMCILIVVTYSRWIPYNKWKATHKLMSIVFLLATLHILFLQKNFNPLLAKNILIFIPMGMGLFGIICKQIVKDFFIKKPVFKVTKMNTINNNVVEISFVSLQKPLLFIPGQYAFFQFYSDKLTKESHPFTLCGSSNNQTLSILVKARGDFTRLIYQHVKPEDFLRIDGPYGKFDYTKAGPSQIWIAGGIGVAPFLAWIRLFEPSMKMRDIIFFYCIHKKEDALFVEEFDTTSRLFPFFKFFLFCSEEKKHLNIEIIQQQAGNLLDKKFLMCGPKKLTHFFNKKLLSLGVAKENIIFEDFEFF